MIKLSRLLPIFVLIMLAAGCSPQGQLSIFANGEDFVRDGFVSKDDWDISFENVYVSVGEITAYQSDPPYDAATGHSPNGQHITLSDTQTVDLKNQLTAGRALISTVDAAVGQYNALSWQMPNSDTGSVQMIGIASKNSEQIEFALMIGRAYEYACGEYVGDERKGFVEVDNGGDIEITFHFDHLFGDGEKPADDPLNIEAVGFEPFAQLATAGQLNLTMDDLKTQLDRDAFGRLENALATLGHVGEGHCYEATNGYTGDE